MDPEAAAKRLETLKEVSKDSIRFAEELLEQNRKLSENLEEMRVVYSTMVIACRELEQLQLNYKDAQSHLSQNAYIIVLVDGDGMVFTEDLLAKGKPGGAEAGKLLIQALTESRWAGSTPEVHVKVFVNMYKLANILQISGRVKEPKNFKDFATGFIQAKEHLYFIDVGDGKEMVDSRIRAELNFHLQNYNCQKVVLGASHDNGYVRILNSIQSSATPHESKVCLLEGPPFASEFHSLQFDTLKFSHIFDSRKLETPRLPPGLPTPPRTVETPAPYPLNSVSYATAAVAPAPAAASRPTTTIHIGSGARSSVVTPQQKTAMAKIKSFQPPPCNDHYILGQCWKESCHFSHKYNLTQLEIQAMQNRVGATRCEFGEGCRNDSCYRGHYCTSVRDGKCTRPNCPFLESEHPEGAYVGPVTRLWSR
ncbi:hypothetical protein C7212DRAFT_281991 [Tuber magnatum]|uniref:C3H1-type domain-containing protein n=1 Tax=Tuber magnatum TaxID=42249 RepID=A0A317SM80_9PEZI|nr:hypothetical protein C7212DRAFT_281991 [Tuber magnatum]